MSVQYQKEIFSNGHLKLLINFIGANSENVIRKKDLGLSFFALNTKTLEPIFSAQLNFTQIKTLYNHLDSVSIIKDEDLSTTNEFIEVTSNIADILAIINNTNSESIKSVLNKINDEEKIALIIEALNEDEIQNLHASIRQTNHKKSLSNLLQLLNLEEENKITDNIKLYPNLEQYAAGQSEKIFQNWIEENIWTLGIDYIKKHPARQIGLSSESDLIMETTDGFIDLIELKRPKFELFDYDPSHKSYYPSRELSKVIGQCLQYLKILDDYKLILEKQYKFKILRPRIKIIIGRTNNFNNEKFEALRMLNSSLNHIQIISYDYLYQCGENIISYYSQELKKAIESPNGNSLPTIS